MNPRSNIIKRLHKAIAIIWHKMVRSVVVVANVFAGLVFLAASVSGPSFVTDFLGSVVTPLIVFFDLLLDLEDCFVVLIIPEEVCLEEVSKKRWNGKKNLMELLFASMSSKEISSSGHLLLGGLLIRLQGIVGFCSSLEGFGVVADFEHLF